jgi:hypothetical protein
MFICFQVNCYCRFFAVWDDPGSWGGELRPYTIYYYLADDTVEVHEDHKKNNGHDPFPLLLRKMKLPKDWKAIPGSNLSL